MQWRLGVDVGGTFTHAVVISPTRSSVVASAKVPTSPDIGCGVVEAIRAVLKNSALSAQDLSLVAHSTTQSTNALLEGDVARVGIVGAARGRSRWIAERATRLGRVPLAPGRFLESEHHFADLSDPNWRSALKRCADDWLKRGIVSTVAASPFSSDDPSLELELASLLRAQGLFCTSTHEISQLYGLRMRTRTAAVNASVLPKMLETASRTERGVRDLGITAPFLVMRSDGGIMSIDEMRRRPVLTLLSGPAAGIAAALRYLQVSDGIFLEVGGTSTDLSLIQGGRAVTRNAKIGGQRTTLRTLDCRTLAMGGGSLPRLDKKGSIKSVGPRSAHGAGLQYLSFANCDLTGLKAIQNTAPRSGDPEDYLIFETPHATRFAFTLTCAQNALGQIPAGDPAFATAEFLPHLECALKNARLENAATLAQEMIERATAQVEPSVIELLRERGLHRDELALVGGGGGAQTLVPALARRLSMSSTSCPNADVISAIGVALGLIRETLERSVVEPTRETLQELRAEARRRVEAQGADPSSIEVFLEVDAKHHRVRADAQGALEFKTRSSDEHSQNLTDAEVGTRAAEVLTVPVESLTTGRSGGLHAFVRHPLLRSRAFRWFGAKKRGRTLIVDSRGVVRLRLPTSDLVSANVSDLPEQLKKSLERWSRVDDGGVTYPSIYTLVDDRIIDLSKIPAPEQMAHILELETRELPRHAPAVLVVTHEVTGGLST